jgi:hypothetical protein
VSKTCAVINGELGYHFSRKGSVVNQNEKTGKYFDDAIKSTLFAINFLEQHSCLHENTVLLDFLVNDIMSVTETTLESCEPYFDIVKQSILPHFTVEELKDYPMLEAINDNDYNLAVKIMRGNVVAQLVGIALPPGTILIEEER